VKFGGKKEGSHGEKVVLGRTIPKLIPMVQRGDP